MTQNRPTTYAFLGGATGGHLFPAIAIAEAIKQAEPDARAIALCSAKPLDAEILRTADAIDAFTPIDARPFSGSPKGILRLAAGWSRSVRQARRALEKAQRDSGGSVCAIAMGGYVAAPGVAAARQLKIPIALVNLDAVPGRANRWISRRSALRIAALHEPTSAGPWSVIPPIIRAGALPSGDAREAKAALGLDPDRRTLLICGASQGARTVNDFITRWVNQHADTLIELGWQVLHQTGTADAQRVADAYDDGSPVVCAPFINDMASAWAAADLVVARSGAGLVGEVYSARTPAVFMPYPFHKDEHQKLNAAPLVDAGLAHVLTDHAEVERNVRAHSAAVLDLVRDDAQRAAMHAAGAALPEPDGAERAAGLIRAHARDHAGRDQRTANS